MVDRIAGVFSLRGNSLRLPPTLKFECLTLLSAWSFAQRFYLRFNHPSIRCTMESERGGNSDMKAVMEQSAFYCHEQVVVEGAFFLP